MAEDLPEYKRKFLVVIDDSPECDRAVTFAANRVRPTGGTVVLLAVIDSADFQQFIGVEEVMRAEARESAERMLDQRIARIKKIGAVRTETAIREGKVTEAIEQVVLAFRQQGVAMVGGYQTHRAEVLDGAVSLTPYTFELGDRVAHVPMALETVAINVDGGSLVGPSLHSR